MDLKRQREMGNPCYRKLKHKSNGPFEAKCIPSTLKRSVVADVSGKSWLGEVQTSSGMFIHKNMVGDRGLSTVREHTVVSGGVHGPGKAVLKRPGLQKSSTSHRGSLTQTQATPVAASDVPSTFSSKPVASEKASLGGKASLQPKRTLMTQEEINAIMGQENEENDGSDDDDDGDDGRENEENEEYEESDDDNDGQENEENAGSDDDDVGSDDDGQENEENVGSDDDGQEHQDFI